MATASETAMKMMMIVVKDFSPWSTRSSNDINSGNKCSEKPELQQQQLADEVCWMKTNKCIMQLLQKI